MRDTEEHGMLLCCVSPVLGCPAGILCSGRDPEGSGGCVTASWGFWGCVRASCALQTAPQAAQRGWCSCSPQNTTSQNAFAAITSKMSFCQPKARRHHQHVTGGQKSS